MKSPDTCMEELTDGKHGKYPYSKAVIDLFDADELEGRLKSIAQAVEYNDFANLHDFALSFGGAINDRLNDLAKTMSEASRSPSDESNESDVRREQ